MCVLPWPRAHACGPQTGESLHLLHLPGMITLKIRFLSDMTFHLLVARSNLLGSPRVEEYLEIYENRKNKNKTKKKKQRNNLLAEGCVTLL